MKVLNLCSECITLFRDAYYIEPTSLKTMKNGKCDQCGKKRNLIECKISVKN